VGWQVASETAYWVETYNISSGLRPLLSRKEANIGKGSSDEPSIDFVFGASDWDTVAGNSYIAAVNSNAFLTWGAFNLFDDGQLVKTSR